MNPRVLLIGGMDSSAGAGLLRDVAAATAAGVQADVAVTAVTAQTDQQLSAWHPVPPKVIAAQIQAAHAVGAVKIGMLGPRVAVKAVVDHLPKAPLVLDPVIRASSGAALSDQGGVAAMLSWLVPRCTLLTPNLPELEALGQLLGVSGDGIVAALLSRGCGAVLVKGGHGDDPAASVDVLFRAEGAPIRYSSARFAVSLRGTGCQLASTIAAHLSAGAVLEQAVQAGKDALTARFAAASTTAATVQ